MSVRAGWFVVVCKSVVFFCFVVLAVAVSGLSKFPTVVIEPGVSPSGSISSASHVLVVSSA